MELDDASPGIELPMERPLFVPPLRATIRQHILLEGEEGLPSEILYGQTHVDRMERLARIRRTLSAKDQVSLSELLTLFPLEEGLEELVVYLSIATEDPRTVISEEREDSVSWTDASGAERRARFPRVVFVR